MKKSESCSEECSKTWIQAGLLLAFSWLLGGLGLQSILENSNLATAFISHASWQWGVLHLFGGEITHDAEGHVMVLTSFLRCLVAIGLLQGFFVFLAALRLRFHVEKVASAVFRMAAWGMIPGVWGILWLVSLINQWGTGQDILQATLVFWVSMMLAGWLCEILAISTSSTSGPKEISGISSPLRPNWKQHLPVFIAVGIYVTCFTAMNWGLWFNLRLPHGDSAMYEEHLWNITHGKGFRSYLDQGLFWGEHIQFVHLLLIPLYWLWPSHLLLEFCESFALGIGAIPVYWMTYRSSQSQKTAVLVSIAYLLYFPLQFLDISIDLKTFRPISFGVPIVLFALDQLERKRFGSASALLLLSLSCKEDFAIIIFSIGLSLLAESIWQTIRERRKLKKTQAANDKIPLTKQKEMIFGAAFLVAGPVYLMFAMNLIRSFRSGVEVHYAGYFSKFGKSTGEIIWNMLTDPGLLLGELLTINTLVYLLALLVPLGFVPLLSGWRCLSCLPMFVLLCLNELSQSPMHHFHGPLLPLLFWALTTGVAQKNPLQNLMPRLKRQKPIEKPLPIDRRGWWVLSSALATSIWFTLTPFGIPFWDAGSNWNGAKLYFPDERAKMFDRIANLIPPTARVASTDFVHPRYTHFERSYDYSNYARKVSGGKVGVPEDTDYIVIDTRHPYSSIHSPDEVREYREHPEQWELLPDRTNGYFLVFKRRR